VVAALAPTGTPVTRIGTVDAAGTDGPRAELCDRDGRVLPVARTGFDHFAAGAA
jgi:hypothetical protein